MTNLLLLSSKAPKGAFVISTILDKGNSDRKNGINNKQNKAVIQITREGIMFAEYHSIHSAERETGTHNASISECCLGKRNMANGFLWAFRN